MGGVGQVVALLWAPAQLVAGGYTRTTNVQDRAGKKLLTGQQSQLAWRRSKGATLFPLTTLLRRCWGWRSYTIPTSTARPETCSSSPLLSEGFLSPVSTQMFPCYRQFSRETNAEAERGDVVGQVVQSPGGMVDGQVVHSSVLAEIEGLIHGDVGGPVLAEAEGLIHRDVGEEERSYAHPHTTLVMVRLCQVCIGLNPTHVMNIKPCLCYVFR